MGKSEIFIIKSLEIHKDKYDYSKVNYINNRKDVEIICKVHGLFFQKPHNHLSGKGCSVCSGNKRMDLEYFLKSSNKKHHYKYDYSLVDFKDSKTSVNIICPKHGIFKQRPTNHLNGAGCFKCGGSEKSNTDDFIRKSNIIHNNTYSYEKVNYKNCKTKVEIICKKHGPFFITPSNHLRRVGCSKCVSKKRLTTEEFIERSIELNGDRFSYEKCNYTNHKKSVIITCKKHGDFEQVANYHLSGHGCFRCKESKSENKIEEFLISKDILYRRQFIFDDLQYKKHLKFDFAILNSDNSVKFMVEYNGQQHYIFKGQYGMKKKHFDEILIRDNLKIEYCKKNKIKIFVIKYDENLDLKLSEIFT